MDTCILAVLVIIIIRMDVSTSLRNKCLVMFVICKLNLVSLDWLCGLFRCNTCACVEGRRSSQRASCYRHAISGHSKHFIVSFKVKYTAIDSATNCCFFASLPLRFVEVVSFTAVACLLFVYHDCWVYDVMPFGFVCLLQRWSHRRRWSTSHQVIARSF